jgi:DNA modification methylase
MNIQKMNIADLNPAKYNPRKRLKPGDAEFEKLKRSIENFGMVEPPIWNSRTGNVVGGHQRLSVMKHLGSTETDVVVVDISEAEEKALNIALNKISGEWDEVLLTDLMAELKTMGFDTELTGFSLDEVEKMFAEPKEVKDDDFDVDKAVSEPPFVMPGDLWHIGKHTLLCGDSTNPDDVKRLLGGQKVNLVLTDPPYNVNYESKGQKIKNDNMSDDDFHKFLFSAFSQAESVMADDASIYVFYADSKGLVFRQAFDEAGFKLASNCVWVKDNFTFGRSDYKWGHEVCLYGWKKSGKHKWFGDMKQSTIWNCPKPKKNDGHPTMKPIPLLAIPVNNSTQTNALVYDPFAGSFSTGVCCEQLGRIAYGMELDPVYASVSVKRMVSAIGSSDGVTVERSGEVLRYSDLVKESNEK